MFLFGLACSDVLAKLTDYALIMPITIIEKHSSLDLFHRKIPLNALNNIATSDMLLLANIKTENYILNHDVMGNRGVLW